MTDQSQPKSAATPIESGEHTDGAESVLLSGAGLKWSLAGFGCLAMVLIVVAFLVDALQSREASYAAGRRTAINMALTLAEHAGRIFENTALILDGINDELKRSTNVGDAERAALAPGLHRRLAFSPQILAVIVFDRQGQPVIDSRSIDHVLVNDDSFYRSLASLAAKAPGTHIGVSLVEPTSGNAAIPVSRALEGSDGTPAGSIVALIDAGYFRSFFHALGLPFQGRVTLVSSEGIIIVSEPEFDRYVGQVVRTRPDFTPFQPGRTAGSYEGRSVLDGQPRIIAYNRLGKTGLVMVVSMSKLAIAAEWRQNSQARGIAAVGICTVLGLLTLLLILQVVRRESSDVAVSHLHMALRETSGQLEVALANMGQGLCLFDSDHRLAIFNDRYLELFNLPAGRVPQGTTLREVMELSAAVGNYSGAEAERAIAERLTIAREGKPRIFIQRLNDGRVIEGVHQPLAEGAFVATYTDVTEREKRALALIDAKEQAEQANRTKTEFLAHMSHELRTPLNAILGFSELLERGYRGALSDRQREYVDHIHASGQHLLDLINQILDLSKVESGRLELVEELVDVGGLVTGSLDLIRHRMASAGLSLEVAVAPDLPLLRGDPLRLRQVLINLLSNASKFTPPGGRVTLSAALTAEGELLLAIADTGIGMSREEIEVALQPFRQIDSPMSRRFEGSGLGLPLSKKLVELHAGRIEILSRRNEGTEVRAIFPAARLSVQTDAEGRQRAPADDSGPAA
jgi:signal transduction histidine kinase